MDSLPKTTHSTTLLSLALIIMTLVAFYPVTGHDFIDYDDDNYVTENPIVLKGLSKEGLVWAFTTNHVGNWHPITWVSHMVDCEMYGLNPMGPHLNNLLLHAANALLLFLILYRVTGKRWRAFFVAALFALHPLRVESVAWVSERKDVLSTFFAFFAMGAYFLYTEKHRLRYYLMSLVFFALSLMSKPMLVTLPFLLLLLDYWPLGRFRFAPPEGPDSKKSFSFLAFEKVPFLLLSLAMSAIAFILQKGSGAMPAFIPMKTRIANALVSYLGYLEKTLWPQDLAVFYPHQGPLIALGDILFSFIFLCAVTILALVARRRLAYFTTGWLWYLGTLVPVIGLVQVGMQAMADRYTYFPLIGIFIILSWGVYDLVKRWRYHGPFLIVAGGLILALLIVSTHEQVGYWKNSRTLFAHALRATQGNYVAHSNLGVAWAREGNLKEAEKHLREALRINPLHASAHNSLGLILFDRGDYGGAARHFREAIRINPNFYAAHNNLGLVLARQKKYEDALREYEEALRINPYDVHALSNQGVLLARQGNLEQAVHPLEKALSIRPDLLSARVTLGSVLVQSGKVDQGLWHLQEGLKKEPRLPQAHFFAGLAYVLKGNPEQAGKHYEMLKSLGSPLAGKLKARLGD